MRADRTATGRGSIITVDEGSPTNGKGASLLFPSRITPRSIREGCAAPVAPSAYTSVKGPTEMQASSSIGSRQTGAGRVDGWRVNRGRVRVVPAFRVSSNRAIGVKTEESAAEKRRTGESVELSSLVGGG